MSESAGEGTQLARIYDSSTWTGRISNVTMTELNRDEISGKIDGALAVLDQRGLTNTKKRQASILLKAANDLIEAPEPPPHVISDLMARVEDVMGLIAFFLGLSTIVGAH